MLFPTRKIIFFVFYILFDFENEVYEGWMRGLPTNYPTFISTVGDSPHSKHLNLIKMEIKGREAMKVQAIGTELEYAKGTKMEGKKYRRFTYGGKVFIAEAGSPFCLAFDKGEIYSLDIDTDTEGQLSLNGFTTTKQEVNMAKTELQLASYTVENWKSGATAKVEELLESEE